MQGVRAIRLYTCGEHHQAYFSRILSIKFVSILCS